MPNTSIPLNAYIHHIEPKPFYESKRNNCSKGGGGQTRTAFDLAVELMNMRRESHHLT